MTEPLPPRTASSAAPVAAADVATATTTASGSADRPALACPKCRPVRLVPTTVEAPGGRGVPVDTCPACDGVWFDARELGATIGEPGADAAVPAFALPARQVGCPRCRVHLFEFCLPGTEVLVDGCRRCQGLWLDREEWSRVREALVAAAQAPRHVCPKCRQSQASPTRCERCGAVFAKVLAQQEAVESFERQVRQDAAAVDLAGVFADVAAVRIRQRVEWLEILSPFERANRYEVLLMGSRHRGLQVHERSRSVLHAIFRQLLGGARPARLTLQDEQGRTLLAMDKPFRLYFHRLRVDDAQGRRLGEVCRRFHPLRENYAVLDRHGRVILEIRGPMFLLPFTDPVFHFLRGGQEVGRMTKRWRGLLRERFTDADAFHASLLRVASPVEKALLFAAVFLIDFGHFEQNQGGGGFDLGDIT